MKELKQQNCSIWGNSRITVASEESYRLADSHCIIIGNVLTLQATYSTSSRWFSIKHGTSNCVQEHFNAGVDDSKCVRGATVLPHGPQNLKF
ncbi:hypothetical protein T09_12744 [Trichinella sp. T9]|uniref:Uncharacterized protein n=1 Tax=Trichinella murrelli TaxID=144512 RepID=A0A0V0U101_9BILA|nr:hypothetical protein T05_16481 [Trichinella murrelli]KRX52275.1 hypothetical protein T09_12744 [Trichinella sp. T9]